MDRMEEEVPQLSLVAQFDDLCRFSNSLAGMGSSEDRMIAFLRNQEECRLQWLAARMESFEAVNNAKRLESENKTLETKLRNVRYALTKEIQAKDKLQQERDHLNRKLNLVCQLLMEGEPKDFRGQGQGESARERILSCLNLHQLEPLLEVADSSDQSSDLDYDKTEEEGLDMSRRVSNGKRKSTGAKSGFGRKSGSSSPTKSASSKKTRSDDGIPADGPVEIAVDVVGEHRQGYADLGQFQAEPRPMLRSESEMIESGLEKHTMITASTPHMQKTEGRLLGGQSRKSSPPATLTRNTTPQDLSRLHYTNRLENRGHTFVVKKVFRPGEKCGPCGGSIGFCGSCLKCRDCRATCHPDCKDKVPLPCIPYVSRGQIGKGNRLTLISDFAPKNSRPMIPGLIIHCCSEIEKRGLDEPGLYRIPGSDREVKELKERILRSKTGMPLLSNIEVHVLCGTIKEFLRSLDEPLVTRVLWRDFVRAAELDDPEDRRTYIYQAVSELPAANRETLAFLLVHLQTIAKSPACKMPTTNLAKVFGPTIVGHSIPDPPMIELLAENKKQIAVMQALLDIPSDYWNNFVAQNPVSLQTIPEGQPGSDRRASIGSRMFGGTVSHGTLTPRHPPKPSTVSGHTPLFLRPLF